MRGKQIRGQNWEVNWAVASHPILLPDTLQSNLQVTLVAIIKTGLLWQCVQLVLSPASDSFKVTGRNKTGRRERDDGRKEGLEDGTNWCLCGLPLLMKSHAKHLNSILEQQTDPTCSDHSAVGMKVSAEVLMKSYQQDPGGLLPAFNYRPSSH